MDYLFHKAILELINKILYNRHAKKQPITPKLTCRYLLLNAEIIPTHKILLIAN